jgi:hypothetical protein
VDDFNSTLIHMVCCLASGARGGGSQILGIVGTVSRTRRVPEQFLSFIKIPWRSDPHSSHIVAGAHSTIRAAEQRNCSSTHKQKLNEQSSLPYEEQASRYSAKKNEKDFQPNKI